MTSAQAQEIYEKNLFQKEAHIHVLSNMMNVKIIVFQDKKPDPLLSTIDAFLYVPGWEHCPSR